jgi:hypothetical protein
MPKKLESRKRPGLAVRNPKNALETRTAQECPGNLNRGTIPVEHIEARKPHWGPERPKNAQETRIEKTSRLSISKHQKSIMNENNTRMHRFNQGNVPVEHLEAPKTHWGPEQPTNAEETRIGETSRLSTSRPEKHIGDKNGPGMPKKLESGKRPG